MNRSLVVSAFVFLTSVAALAADSNFERTLSTSGSPAVSVVSGSGFIHLHPGSGNQVRVAAHVHANGSSWFGRNADRNIQQTVANPPIQQSGDNINIGERGNSDLYRNISIDYDITLPQGSDITAQSGSGDVEINDVGRALKAGSGSGSVRARSIHGPANLQTGSGDLDLSETAAGDVRAQTGSGSIHLHNVSGGLRAGTGSGDIEVDGKLTSDWKLDTGSGSVRLKVGPESRFNLDAATGSGSVRVTPPLSLQGQIDHHHVTGSVNGGGPVLRARTGSGDIEIQ